jgi:hypothetical protein
MQNYVGNCTHHQNNMKTTKEKKKDSIKAGLWGARDHQQKEKSYMHRANS